MNGKYIASLLALTCVLSGCSRTEESSEQSTTSTFSTTGVISTFGTTSSTTVASESSTTLTSETSTATSESSTTTLNENSTTTTTESSSSTVSSSSASATTTTSPSTTSSIAESVPLPDNVERTVIEKNGVRTVAGGETLNIRSGELLEIQGTLSIENGAAVIVENGGELFVNGNVELNGELTLSNGGRLTMGNDSAVIDGAGNLAVKDSFEQINSEHGIIYARITPPERVFSNGVTRVGGVVIANKAISLPPEFGSHLSLNEVEPEVYAALKEMCAAAGHQYVIRSGYRSYWNQVSTFQNNVDLFGLERAEMLSSRAGHSEHQTGLTMDLDSFDQNWGTTAYGKWLAENCWKYGFIIRYPKGKENITGYEYEPWHVRYLGKSTASLVYHSGLTLEEFLNVEGGTVVID